MWQRSAGLRGSCGQLHKGRGLLSRQYKSIQRVWLTSVCTQIETGCKHLQRGNVSLDTGDGVFLCEPIFLLTPPYLFSARQECISLHPEPNPLFEVASSSLRSPSRPCLSSACQTVSSVRAPCPPPPASCSCAEGHRHLHCPPLPHPHASAPGHITPATCAGRKSPWDLSSGSLSSTPHLAPSEPLIPSSRHPVTEEWPVQRAQRGPGRRATQSSCCRDVFKAEPEGITAGELCV